MICFRPTSCFSLFPWLLSACSSTVMKLRRRRVVASLAALLHTRALTRGRESPPRVVMICCWKILGIYENNRGVTRTNRIIGFKNAAESMIPFRGWYSHCRIDMCHHQGPTSFDENTSRRPYSDGNHLLLSPRMIHPLSSPPPLPLLLRAAPPTPRIFLSLLQFRFDAVDPHENHRANGGEHIHRQN